MQTPVITRDPEFFMMLKGKKGIINKFLVLINFFALFELINAVEIPGNCYFIYD
jgi:hypothetical protein